MKQNRSSRSASARVRRAPERTVEDCRVLERSDNVHWTLASKGILLHNFAHRCFLELDEVGYRAWGLLDGARSADDVVATCCAEFAGSHGDTGLDQAVRDIVNTLYSHGFIVERVFEDRPASETDKETGSTA